MSKKSELVFTIDADELPNGWSLASISDLVGSNGVFVDGDWVESKDQDPNGDVRLIQLADVGDGSYRDKSSRFLTQQKAMALNCTFLEREDVLIARMPDPLGRACIFPGDRKDAVTVVDVAVVRSGAESFNHRWLMHFVNAPAFRSAVASLQSGSTRKRISRKNLARIMLPVPPREQQDEIVAEIEKQFSRLDEAAANLKRVKANLKRYKAAVLKAAVEGKLTEQWRKAHPDVEPASKLLDRILAERRAKWEEAALAKMETKGKAPKNDMWKEKYKEPSPPDTVDLPDLPEGWVYATAEQLTDETRAITYGVIKLGDPVDGGVPVLRSSDVRQLRIDFDNVKRIAPEIAGNYRRTFLRGGEVVMTVRGTLGGIAVVPPQCSGFNVSREVAMLALVDPALARVVAVFVASVPLDNWLMRRAKGIAYTGINIETLKALPIPVPPSVEQHPIVADVDRHLSLIHEIDAQVDANLKRAERLRQSILSSAFCGAMLTRIDEAPGGARTEAKANVI